MFAEMTGANEKYTMKRYVNVQIGLIIQKSFEHVWHVEKYLKMLDFPKKRDKTFRLLRNTQVSFHMYRYPSPGDGYWNRNVNVDFTS